MAEAATEYRGAIDKGLEGVVTCTTRISSILGATLCYRGYTIEDLAENSSFEEVVYLLWNDKLPNAAELEAFRRDLGQQMALPAPLLEMMRSYISFFPKSCPPMDFLRTVASALSALDPDINDNSDEANRRKALKLTARMGTIIATFECLRKGLPPPAPVAGRSVAWNFLNGIFGKAPSPEFEEIFDTALILHADHEINCSAFATRVTISGLSDINSGVVSSIGTLKGPLHGGANEAVIRMLEKIGSVENAKTFVEQALAGKQKVMGIGHRVYKNGDPRARILRRLSEQLCKEAGKPHLYEMSVIIDETMQAQKGLMPNVDFYSATVYHCLGIPTDLFTPIFAASRVSGWCAHAMEQYSNNRIYRPRGDYQGKSGLSWKPLAAR